MATVKKKMKSKVAAKSKVAKKVVKKAKAKSKPVVKAKVKMAAKAKAPAMAKTPNSLKWDRLISPLEDRVIVSFETPKSVTAGGIIIPGSVTEVPNKGKVLAVGPGRRSKKGKLRPLDVKVGDEILFPQHAGSKMTVQNTEILILREDEVLGIIQ